MDRRSTGICWHTEEVEVGIHLLPSTSSSITIQQFHLFTTTMIVVVEEVEL